MTHHQRPLTPAVPLHVPPVARYRLNTFVARYYGADIDPGNEGYAVAVTAPRMPRGYGQILTRIIERQVVLTDA